MLNRLMTGATYGVFSGAAHAAGAAACSAAGAGILAAAHHSGYHAAPQAASGAVGGAVLSGGLALITGLVAPDAVAARFSRNETSVQPAVVELATSVSSVVLAGMVGAAILRDVGHGNMPSTGHAAAASAVGAAVIFGGSLVLSLFLCAPVRRNLSTGEV